jgi:hypothetical protein
MSDQPILFCPQCNHVCKSLRGLAQHITHWLACCQKSLPSLDGIRIQKPTVHQSFVQLDALYADEAMEPMWQQNDDPDTFAALQPFPDAVDLNVDSATLQFVSNQRNQLDNHISRQLADKGLVDSSTMLDTEDRQDIMLDTDESYAFEDDEVIMDASTNVFDVDHSDDLLQFTDPLWGQHCQHRQTRDSAFSWDQDSVWIASSDGFCLESDLDLVCTASPVGIHPPSDLD